MKWKTKVFRCPFIKCNYTTSSLLCLNDHMRIEHGVVWGQGNNERQHNAIYRHGNRLYIRHRLDMGLPGLDTMKKILVLDTLDLNDPFDKMIIDLVKKGELTMSIVVLKRKHD